MERISPKNIKQTLSHQYTTLRPELLLDARRMLESKHAADIEDVVQEAFTDTDPRRIHNEVFLTNRIRVHSRAIRDSRKREVLSGVPAAEKNSTDTEFEERTLQAEILRESLVKLGHFYSEVLIMKYYENLSASEIAKLIGISTSTVNDRLSHGRARLRNMLRRSGEFR